MLFTFYFLRALSLWKVWYIINVILFLGVEKEDEKPLESLDQQLAETDSTHSHPSATPFSDLLNEAAGGLSELEMSLPRVLPGTNNELELSHMTDNTADENEADLGHLTEDVTNPRAENTINMERLERDRGIVGTSDKSEFSDLKFLISSQTNSIAVMTTDWIKSNYWKTNFLLKQFSHWLMSGVAESIFFGCKVYILKVENMKRALEVR